MVSSLTRSAERDTAAAISTASRRSIYLLTALLFAVGLVSVVQLPRLRNPLTVEEDFRSLHWVHRYQRPELFPTEDLSWRGVYDLDVGPVTLVIEDASPGYSLLLQAGSYLWPPEFLHKLLAFPLILAAAFFSFRIGQHIGGDRVGLALSATLVALNLVSSTELSVVGGLHRSFAIPLLLALLYYLLVGRRWAAAAAVGLMGLIYLPHFPVAMMTYLLAQVRLDGGRKLVVDRRGLLPLAVAVVVVGLAVSPSILRQMGGAPLPVATETAEGANVLADPQFSVRGRLPLFVRFPFIGQGGLFSHGEDFLIFAILLALAVAEWLVLRKRRVRLPSVAWKLLVAGVAGYGLSWLAVLATSSFLLYLPSRHVQSSLFLVMLTFVVVNGAPAFRRGAELAAQHRRRLPALAAPLAAAAVVLAVSLPATSNVSEGGFSGRTSRALLAGLAILLMLLATVVSLRRRTPEATQVEATGGRAFGRLAGGAFAALAVPFVLTLGPEFYTPSASQSRLYSFLESLPIDSVIAGSPCLLDDVPFYAKRSVVMSCERFRPDQTLIVESLLGYYGETPEAVLAYCGRYGADYLVVHEREFAAEAVAGGTFFFEPYNSLVAAEIASRDRFALAEARGRIYEEGPVFVVPCTAEALAAGE